MTRKRREAALALLQARDLNKTVEWALGERGAFRTLNSLVYNSDKLIEWRAIEAIGKIAARKAEVDLESARDLVRRQFWSMTEESGGTAWRAPEVIGEVLHNVPDLTKEFGRLLAPFFHEEPFERGACWAAFRAAQVNPEPFHDIEDELVALFKVSDPYMRYHAVSTLLAMGKQDLLDLATLKSAASAEERIWIYDFESGIMKETQLELPVK